MTYVMDGVSDVLAEYDIPKCRDFAGSLICNAGGLGETGQQFAAWWRPSSDMMSTLESSAFRHASQQCFRAIRNLCPQPDS